MILDLVHQVFVSAATLPFLRRLLQRLQRIGSPTAGGCHYRPVPGDFWQGRNALVS